MLLTLLVAGTSGCAHTLNYLDPVAPRHEQALAPPIDPAACADEARDLSVVTFNVQFARQVDLAIEVLRKTPADVLLLQEMDAPGVERMAAALGLNALFLPSGVHPKTHREFGTAVLSRWSIENGRRLVLPHPAYWTRLATTATTAEVGCGPYRVGVMSVHLPSPVSALHDERREQVEAILARAASIDGPVVIGGDFNAGWIGTLFEDAGFAWLNKDLPATRSLLGIGQKLDHLFARGVELADDGPAAGVADPEGASDHKPIWVRLAIPPVRAR